MKGTLLIIAAAVVPSLVYLSNQKSVSPEITITRQVEVHQVPRIGINLGTWTSWGAEQLMTNVLKNPGFEGNINRTIAVAKTVSAISFTDDQNWLGRPDGFWSGASLEVLSGSNLGRTGKIAYSRSRNHDGYPVYHFAQDKAGPLLNPGDAASLTRLNDSELPAGWWFNATPGVSYQPEPRDKRPDSPGSQSLRVSSESYAVARVDSYLDAIGQRAGKLLPVEGPWKFSFWAKREFGSATLRVSFGRNGNTPFFDKALLISRGWRAYEVSFTGADTGPPGILDLRFELQGAPSGAVLLDDVALRRVSDVSADFRREVVEVLQQLRPGYLRDWQGQLGDTFENRVANSFARRTSRYRPGDQSQADYAYGLEEFVRLSAQVGASPWIVVPTTFSEGECGRLGAFLANQAKTKKFAEVLTEFGNENWNLIFRPAGIPNAINHGQAADRCFAAIRRSSGELALRTVINAQHANPAAVAEFARASKESDVLAVAPYFLPELNAGQSPVLILPTLFSGDEGRMKAIARVAQQSYKEPAIYEINLHTDGGNAPDAERTPITSGAASGTALAIRMLDALSLGARRQCSYVLAGFDNRSAAPGGFVRLWGNTRDLISSHHLRPTALALKLMNRAILGDLMRSDSSDDAVHSFAFRDQKQWTLVLASTSDSCKQVRVRFPAEGVLPTFALTLQAASPLATNEDGEHVRLSSSRLPLQGRSTSISLAPYGLMALVKDEQ